MSKLVSALRPPSSADLRSYTPARVSLAMTGHSIATSEVLSFQLAHAQARDAVHSTLHLASLAQRINNELPILSERHIPILPLRTLAPDRAAYLRQPHLGRSLHPDSAAQLAHLAHGDYDLAVIVADGLSALAIERNAIPLLMHLLPQLVAAGWSLAPIGLVEQGRVAIGDRIGHSLGARLSLVLIGERPGLSSFDSLGAYLTWRPHVERTDADRNCISNIRDGGLSAEAAAAKLLWYLEAARERQLTGIALKEGAAERDKLNIPKSQQGTLLPGH